MHTPCSPGWISWYLGKQGLAGRSVCALSQTHGKRELWNPQWYGLPPSFQQLYPLSVFKGLCPELTPQALHKVKPRVALWNHWLYFPRIEQGPNLPTRGVAVSCESAKTAEDSFGPLNTLFLIRGETGEFAPSHLLKYNSLKNIKQAHSAFCRHIITLCAHVTHICSILAVHLVDVWETPRFKVSSVSFVL